MARQKKDGHFFNCYVKQIIWEAVEDYSKKTGFSKTALVENALEEYFERHPIPEKQK